MKIFNNSLLNKKKKKVRIFSKEKILKTWKYENFRILRNRIITISWGNYSNKKRVEEKNMIILVIIIIIIITNIISSSKT